MNFAGDHVFSGPAFAADEAIEVGLRDLFDDCAEFLNCEADADEQGRFVRALEGGPGGARHGLGAGVHRAGEGGADFGQAERFREKIGGAAAHAFDDELGGGIDRDADYAGCTGRFD